MCPAGSEPADVRRRSVVRLPVAHSAAFRRAARRPYKSPSGCPKFTFRRGFNEILIILLFKVINWAISYFSPVTGAIPEAVATLGG